MKKVTTGNLIKLHGSTKPVPDPVILKAGVLTVLYENGTLRAISSDGHEIIRMIYAAVRDEKWITVEPVITNEFINTSEPGFKITYHALYRYNEIDFEADYVISGNSDNEINFEMKGRANESFKKNRIGFCILHPIQTCKGKPCTIFHPDGSSSLALFPEDISPHQPFRNICALQWKINDNVKVQVDFHGDIFETEDQRNWTDASYKTYSTPLSLPYPVVLRKNSTIQQTVRLKVTGSIKIQEKYTQKVVFSLKGSEVMPIPSTGTCVSSRQERITLNEAELLKQTGLSHLRAEIHLFSESYPEQYDKAVSEAQLLNLPVELCLVFSERWQSELENFLTIYRRNPVIISSVILLSQNHKVTPDELIRNVSPVMKKHFPGVATGAGTNCNFAQLNRQTPDTAMTDFISFAIHPQEHAGDDLTLIENVAAQHDAAKSAIKLAGNKAVHISPVTLQRRFNANETNYEIPGECDKLPAQVDVRQMSLFGAVWTVGSMKYIFESGVSSVTYYESVGERGIIMGEYPSLWPEFPSEKNMLFPMYYVFRYIDPHYRVMPSISNSPLVIDGFVLCGEKEGLIFLSNFTAKEQQAEVKGFTGLKTIMYLNSKGIISKEEYSYSLNETAFIMKPYETRLLKFDHRINI